MVSSGEPQKGVDGKEHAAFVHGDVTGAEHVAVCLLTNNPKKVAGLEQLGVKVSERVPLIMPPNQYNRFYLETKREKSGHLIDVLGKERLPEQLDRPVLEGMSREQAMDIQD